uniref:Uncharacterized protein n=1 Tax=Lotus japonicus TaxID=34305 RepID=I3S0L0_LOTJA|nr:unknown [Lotus japonicus]
MSPKTKLPQQKQKVEVLINLQIPFPIQTLTLIHSTPQEDPKENHALDAPTTPRFVRPNPKTPLALASPEHAKHRLLWEKLN